MRSIVLTIALSLGLSSAAFAGSYEDQCVGPNVVENEWLVSVNHEDQASKQDIVQTLGLFTEAGFSGSLLFVIPEEGYINYHLKFDPDYFENWDDAEAHKNAVLGMIAGTAGNIIECNGIVGPLPAIGIR